MCGTRRLTEGPGLSAFMRLIVEPPIRGRIDIIKTNTPMPPIQWLKLRQKRLACDRDSTSERILEPVAVKPETVSNRAST